MNTNGEKIKTETSNNDDSFYLTFLEQKYLLGVLKERLGVQRQGIYHTDSSTFKESMRQEESMIRNLIEKLKIELLKPVE